VRDRLEITALRDAEALIGRAAATARRRRPTAAPTPALGVEYLNISHCHRPRDSHLRRLLAASDAAALLLGAILAGALPWTGDFGGHLGWFVATMPVWLALFGAYRLYGADMRRVSHSTVDDIPGIFHAFSIGSVGLWGYFQLVSDGKVAFLSVLAFAVAAASAMALMRHGVRGFAQRLMGPERVLFIGAGATTALLERRMSDLPGSHLKPVGVLARDDDPSIPLSTPVLGRFEAVDLEGVVRAQSIDRVVASGFALGPNDRRDDETLDMLRRCRRLAVKVSLVPAGSDAIGSSAEVDHIGGVTVLGLNPPVLSRSAGSAKRAVDILGSALLLIIAAPLLMVIAGLVRATSHGPALFRQQRVGRGGRRFEVLKFRTMVAGAEQLRAALLSESKDPDWLLLDRDPRVTRVGRFLRNSSLDELPQLVNVLRGDMSLVGPRPLIVEEDCRLGGWHRARVDLLPGITGPWQVLGRTSIPFEEMIKLDYLYVTNWSLWGDVRLILRTVPAVLSRQGVN
jgi:exopolysaccharide biosynthesis polyprenyl glycosylphosphotransferase